MKKNIAIALVAILSISLLTGCVAATTTNKVESGLSKQSGNTVTQVEATQLGAGYRGGNSDAGTSNSDDCDLTYNDVTTADPTYTLDEASKTLSVLGYGSEGALKDDSLTLADMLTYAIQDEYLARAEYNWIVTSFGNARPFTNIMRAEETHIESLLPLFEIYAIATPADEGASHAVAVPSLTGAYQAGVNAEVNNIAMYEIFLEQDLPENVRAVFESLMRASENHLRAFQNQL